MSSIIPASKLRFAVLGVEGDSSSGSEADEDVVHHGTRKDGGGRGGGGGGGGGGGAGRGGVGRGDGGAGGAAGEKKRARKKKKKEKMIEQTNELRNLAFKKLPVRPAVRVEGDASSPHAQLDSQKPNGEQRSNGERSLVADGVPDEGTCGQLDTLETFDADLQRALRLSKMEYEFQKTQGVVDPDGVPRVPNRKERRKLLQEARDRDVAPRMVEVLLPPEPTPAHAAQTDGAADAPSGGGSSTNSSRATDRSRGGSRGSSGSAAAAVLSCRGAAEEPPAERAARLPSPVLETVRIEQLKDGLAKKDKEIADLKVVTAEWEVKFKEVKKRNAQLLYMLQQGEMKEKSDVLLQVEELTNIKNELTQQVSDLHTALEQERSKVKTLQAELVKHQGGKKIRKASESEH
ncbi:G kinase-anchoring protein 1 isoform X2 [Petromyzon marinus]|uniref:G kinase-anchoring protein 1 isoform X2 n=1 Tax=Petromyzon marinus TaxID=7757 RepID=A0AAJ7U6I2_PETMA|nr:G kinase-anchoring protein 1 isoform X2 [Petromyzon marinus]